MLLRIRKTAVNEGNVDASLVSLPSKKEIFLKDYTAPNFSIENIFLNFELFDAEAIVTAKTSFKKLMPSCSDLELDGGPYMD